MCVMDSMLTPRMPVTRMAFLFQSYQQTVSWFSTLAVTLSGIYLIAAAFELQNMPSYLLFASVIFGSCFSLVFALPFRLKIASREKHVEERMTQSIEAAGYSMEEQLGGRTNIVRYAQWGPKWLRGNESSGSGSRGSGGIEIDGPLIVLLKLRSIAKAISCK